MEYMQKIQVLHHERYVPFFLASIGAHVANLKNKEPKRKPFYSISGEIEDLRLHLFFIAPPGFGKSYYDLLYFDKVNGIGASMPNHHLDKITEAGLVGSVDELGKKIGLAEEMPDAIIWADEFAGISKQGKKQHSLDLDETMLSLLADGHVSKRMKNGSIDFDSYVTLWAATQSERVELASGFPRRFCFLDGLPNTDDIKKFKAARRKGRGISPDGKEIENLRGLFSKFCKDFNVQKIEFGKGYDSLTDEWDTTHTTDQVLERLAVGYHAIRFWQPGDKTLNIFMDDKLGEMFRQEIRWRAISQRNLTDAQVLRFFEDEEVEWELTPLKRTLEQIGISYDRSTTKIQAFRTNGVLKVEEREKKGSKRPVSYVRRGPKFEDLSAED